jgi:ribonuclease P protein component
MFPKKHRAPREIIKKVLFEGKKIHTELFLLRKNENNLNKNRFAIVVSKKVAKTAVKRHYLKRLFKNIILDYFKNIENKGFDFVFILNKKANDANKDDIMSILSKINF